MTTEDAFRAKYKETWARWLWLLVALKHPPEFQLEIVELTMKRERYAWGGRA